jgi:tetratricopeptide (TPR) repeat protein
MIHGREGVLYNEANTLHMLGNYQAALECYQRSITGEDSTLTGSTLHNAGNTLMKMGNPQEAVATYTQALQYTPDDPDVMHNLEMALRMLEEQQKQQQDKQRRDQEQEKGDSKDKQGDSQQDRDRQQQEQQGEQEQEQQQNQQDQQKQEQNQQADSSSVEPQRPDSSSAAGIDPEMLQKLSKEDALRILQALEEQEKNLQKEKKKAAFKKVKRSGKDW